MAFGRNPHVTKAQAAERKARDASDDSARALALRDAAHQWDRAAEREQPGKRRDEYARNAAHARALADGGAVEEPEGEEEANGPADPNLLN
jgi:hypothetical protein